MHPFRTQSRNDTAPYCGPILSRNGMEGIGREWRGEERLWSSSSYRPPVRDASGPSERGGR